jgi:hypothetical protein
MRLASLGLRIGVIPLAIAAGSCSDPVPQTARGAWTVSWNDPGVDCNVAGHNTKVGDVDDSHKNTVVIDGEAGAEVQCSVTGSGTFTVDAHARLSGPLRYLQISIPGIAPGTTVDKAAKGTVAYANSTQPGTAGETYVSPQDNACEFYFANGNQTVDAGKIWVTFTCPAMVNGSDTCAITRGYALFEDCDDGSEDD